MHTGPKFCFWTSRARDWIHKAALRCGKRCGALRDQGITVVLTTHYMEEADELCDRLAIIDHGKILVEDTPATLKASVGGGQDLRSAVG